MKGRTMKLAPGWSDDVEAAPKGQSLILACVYADQRDAWFRGEAVRERKDDGGDWFWISGRRVEPDFIPKAWMPMPWVLADD